MSEPTEAQIMAARKAAWKLGISEPFGARVADYPDPADLQAADAQAERQNMEAWRGILRAALSATEAQA